MTASVQNGCDNGRQENGHANQEASRGFELGLVTLDILPHRRSVGKPGRNEGIPWGIGHDERIQAINHGFVNSF